MVKDPNSVSVEAMATVVGDYICMYIVVNAVSELRKAHHGSL